MPGGICVSGIHCNRGEPSKLYLKAYEITPNTPLSETRLKGRTSEFFSWSKDPKELFQSHVTFTI